MITNLIFTSIASAVIIVTCCCSKIENPTKQIFAIVALSIIIIAATFLEMYSSWISSEKKRKERKDKENNDTKLFSILSKAQEIIYEYFEKENINDIKVQISIGNTDKLPKDWILTAVVDYKDKENNDKSKYIELGPINDIETSMNNLIAEIEVIRMNLDV